MELRAQASAGYITADDAAEKFHLSPVQQMVLANETGPDASPFFSAGGFAPKLVFKSYTPMLDCQ